MLRAITVCSLLLFLVAFPVLAEKIVEPAPPASITTAEIQQQVSIIVKRENEALKVEILANQDENFKTFDDRITAMLTNFLKKLIIGLLGGMTVVLVGYAWLMNYAMRKYTPTFQRNVLKSKLKKLEDSGKMVSEQQKRESDSGQQKVAARDIYPQSQTNPFYEPLYKAKPDQKLVVAPAAPAAVSAGEEGGAPGFVKVKRRYVMWALVVLLVLAAIGAGIYLFSSQLGISSLWGGANNSVNVTMQDVVMQGGG